MKHMQHCDYGDDYDMIWHFYHECSKKFNQDLTTPFERREKLARKALFSDPTKSKLIKTHQYLCKYKDLWSVGRTPLGEKPVSRNFIYNYVGEDNLTNYILAIKPDLPNTNDTIDDLRYRNTTKTSKSEEVLY